MTFAERVKTARISLGYTQKQLAEAAHLSLRTIISYEQGNSRPKTGDIYVALAEALNVSKSYLLTRDEEFVLMAAERYGVRGAAQAQDVIQGFAGLCAGGTLSEQDMDAVMKALQDIYWESKTRNKQKYTPQKNRES